jgi:isoquinoline 1-oxidoreductase beta subunit
MTQSKIASNRRAFLKNTLFAGGGIIIGFDWLAQQSLTPKDTLALPKEWFDFNSYLKIGDVAILHHMLT